MFFETDLRFRISAAFMSSVASCFHFDVIDFGSCRLRRIER
jgi:hypothetical protein